MTADAMRSARLCMVPSGDTPTSRRLYDALAAGASPSSVGDRSLCWPRSCQPGSKSASHSLPFPRTVNWPDVVVAYSPQYVSPSRTKRSERSVLRGMSLNKTVWQICRSEKQRGMNESASCRNRRGGMKVTREAYANATSEGTEKCRQLEAEWLESRASANWSHQLGQRALAACAHLDVEGNPVGVADAFLREVLVTSIFLEENAERQQSGTSSLAEEGAGRRRQKAQKRRRSRAQLKAPKTSPDSRMACCSGSPPPDSAAFVCCRRAITFQGGPNRHIRPRRSRVRPYGTQAARRRGVTRGIAAALRRAHAAGRLQRGALRRDAPARPPVPHALAVAAANDVALLCAR